MKSSEGRNMLITRGRMMTSMGALSAFSVASPLDFSHTQNSPEHAGACIDALRKSGMRAVFGYG